MKKKKVFLVVSIIVMLTTIIGLSVALYHTTTSLKATQADLAGMSFKQGDVVESKSGGIVTVSLKNWSYFRNDDFITSSKPVPEGTLEGIFCSLHTGGHVDSFNGNLAKLKFSKQVTVKSGTSSEKTYYLVGNYYIADTNVG